MFTNEWYLLQVPVTRILHENNDKWAIHKHKNLANVISTGNSGLASYVTLAVPLFNVIALF